MKYVYPACFYPLENEDGYLVEIPDLKGCTTQGKNMANAIEMAIDAASGWILDELEDGNKIPAASPVNKVVPDEADGIVSLIVLDMERYTEMHGNKAVRKNLTVPAWLATAADKKCINYSAVLQEALIQKLEIN
jgi:predicted RNase H-like HicB family nuclease